MTRVWFSPACSCIVHHQIHLILTPCNYSWNRRVLLSLQFSQVIWKDHMCNPIGVCQWMRTTPFLSPCLAIYKRRAQFEGCHLHIPLSQLRTSYRIPAAMSNLNGLYYIEAYPLIDISNLYATGNGINETITVNKHKEPFIERQVVSTRHLHIFWMVKTANTFLSILFSGTSNPSWVAGKANMPSLSTPREAPLEEVGTRRTGSLLLRATSLLQKMLTPGSFRMWTVRFPTSTRTYM